MLISPHVKQKKLNEIEENPSSPLSKISGKLSLANEGSQVTCFQVSIQTQ